jgi:hypothetical protein
LFCNCSLPHPGDYEESHGFSAAAFTVNPAKEAKAAIYDDTRTGDYIERVGVNQQQLTAELKPHYDFIVCGSGSSGGFWPRSSGRKLKE